MSEIIEKIKKFRPPLSLLLRLSCVFTLVYYSVYMLLFLFSLMFKDFITEFSQLYIPDAALNPYEVMLMLLAGFLINAGVVTGLIFMLIKRNIGPFLYTFSATLILIYQFIMGNYLLTDKFVVEIFLLMLILVLRIWFSKARQKSNSFPIGQDAVS
ncbi:MAG: hypothetical protein HOO86_09250 [Bacteroidales bacterium]|nr:hypothetical protein [Bacteroidales bacterium]